MVQLMRRRKTDEPVESPEATARMSIRLIEAVPIPAGDPLETVLLSHGGPLGAGHVDLESETLDPSRNRASSWSCRSSARVSLLGALYLGPRLSDQPYSTDDRRLLGSLASQVAPAMKVAQLVREQQAEAKERERIQQEMQVAALIQQTLLPRDLPCHLRLGDRRLLSPGAGRRRRLLRLHPSRGRPSRRGDR